MQVDCTVYFYNSQSLSNMLSLVSLLVICYGVQLNYCVFDDCNGPVAHGILLCVVLYLTRKLSLK